MWDVRDWLYPTANCPHGPLSKSVFLKFISFKSNYFFLWLVSVLITVITGCYTYSDHSEFVTICLLEKLPWHHQLWSSHNEQALLSLTKCYCLLDCKLFDLKQWNWKCLLAETCIQDFCNQYIASSVCIITIKLLFLTGIVN